MSHIVTIVDGEATVECTEPVDPACHNYPDCECDYYYAGHESEHPSVMHQECSVVEWFGAVHAEDMYYPGGRYDAPPQNAKGTIATDWDDGLLWSFADLEAALAASATTEGA